MKKKAEIMDRNAVNRALTRISHEIIEKNKGIEDLFIIGIRRRGVSLAKTILNNISAVEGKTPEYGELDITFYRDDLTVQKNEGLREKPTFDSNDKKIVLVDDVIFTGRTVRAAIDCLMDIGRPKCIQLAVLIDRGHRELPIRADYVGQNDSHPA